MIFIKYFPGLIAIFVLALQLQSCYLASWSASVPPGPRPCSSFSPWPSLPLDSLSAPIFSPNNSPTPDLLDRQLYSTALATPNSSLVHTLASLATAPALGYVYSLSFPAFLPHLIFSKSTLYCDSDKNSFTEV